MNGNYDSKRDREWLDREMGIQKPKGLHEDGTTLVLDFNTAEEAAQVLASLADQRKRATADGYKGPKADAEGLRRVLANAKRGDR